MQLGITIDMSGPAPKLDMDRVLEAERLGFSQVWSGESYSTDAVSPVAWVLARTTRIRAGTGIMQIPARTPACAAMTAMALQALSGNRFMLGVGVSGPQVIEGWHGVAFGKPLARTKEYVAIIRAILAREKPVTFSGEHYTIPYAGPDATGLGKPLRSIIHGNSDLPIYTAAITPAGLAYGRRDRRRHAADLLFARTAEVGDRSDRRRHAPSGARGWRRRFRCRAICARAHGTRCRRLPRRAAA